MGYFLIIMGVIAVIAGIIMLTRNSDPTVSMTVNKTTESKEPTESLNHPAPAHDSATLNRRDTVEVERVVEKTIEMDVSQKVEESDLINTNKSTDSNKAKGDAFEDFVVNLLADWRLKLLDRTQDHKSSAGVVAESSKNPDLHVEQKRGKSEIDYYIECKYRSHWDEGKVNFEEWQIKRYRQFQTKSHRKVLIALGVGGSPSSPNTLRLVPIDSIQNNYIREIDTQFALQPNTGSFIQYMNSYFTNVFKSAQDRKTNS